MVYITGDTHGDFKRYVPFTLEHNPDEHDVMIVLGDAGLNLYENEADAMHKRFVNSFPFTTFCIHGNHEKRPFDIPSYKTKEFCGGTVWYEEAYPRILFAKDGEVYRFADCSCLVIGGAYSVDKDVRLSLGYAWFENEQPSPAIREETQRRLASIGHTVDVLLTHTAPLSYEPREVFLPHLDQSTVDKSTEQWLDTIERSTSYKKWYCGHYHTDKTDGRLRFMYRDIEVFSAD